MALTTAQKNALALIGLTGNHQGVHLNTLLGLNGDYYVFNIERRGAGGYYELTELGQSEANDSPLGKAALYLFDLGYVVGRSYGADDDNLRYKPGYVPFKHKDNSRQGAFTGTKGGVYISRPQAQGGTYLAAHFGSVKRAKAIA